MDGDQFWHLEQRFWLEGASVYEAHLHQEAQMIFPQMGILDHDAVIASMHAAPRWDVVEMTQKRIMHTRAATFLVYGVNARRGEGRPYQAYCCSSYIRSGGEWLMMTHQHTSR